MSEFTHMQKLVLTFVSCLLLAHSYTINAASDTVSQAVSNSAPVVERAFAAWEEVVYKAAHAALNAVGKQSGAELTLRDVPLDTLQVYTGRQHHIGLSIDGVQYEVVIGNEHEAHQQQDAARQADAAALPASDIQEQATPGDTIISSGLVKHHWQSQLQPSLDQAPALPDVTLSGPLELVLATPGVVSFYTPNPTDSAGLVARVRVAPGTCIRLRGLKSIQLRQPLDLPSLPVGYMAEVLAHARLQNPGEDFDKAPGVGYLTSQLRALAMNTSLPLLSFEVVPASEAAGLVVTSAEELPGGVAPRIKVKRSKGGLVELSVREDQVQVADEMEAVLNKAKALARPWAWPLPHVDLSSLMPYEALLRSILSSHQLDWLKVQEHGISMKLTKSEIRGTRLMAFEMEVRSQTPKKSKAKDGTDETGTESDGSDSSNADAGNDDGFGMADEGAVMVFDVVVAVRQRSEISLTDPAVSASGSSSKDGQSGSPNDLLYVPVSVKLREVHGNTISMSRSAMAAILASAAGGNATLPAPIGYDHEDLGMARMQAA